MHGQCTYEVPHYEHDDVWIAWGGVAAQAAILLVAVIAHYLLWHHLNWTLQRYTGPLFRALIGANIATILFNLLPIAPLDGRKAWRVIPLGRDALREKWLSMKSRKSRKELEESSRKLAAEVIEKLRSASKVD
jgi:stage IV sporulation protein FB